MTVLDWADAVDLLEGTGPVYLAGCCGEPTDFLETLAVDPEVAADRCFTGVWIPGVNKRDPTENKFSSSALAPFVTPQLGGGITTGRIDVLPMHYSEIYRWLNGPAGLSGAIFQVSTPLNGHVSLGVATDFTPAVVAAGVPLIGQINPLMPVPSSAPTIPVERFLALVPGETLLPTYDSGPISRTYKTIAKHVVDLIQDGDTLQLGLGKLQAAVLGTLNRYSNLSVHAGMVSASLLDCLDDGIFDAGVITGVALGNANFYERVAADKRIIFKPVNYTHDTAVLSAIHSLTAINSMIEVDLFGQGNGEYVNRQQVSSHGGVLDFMRGARVSQNGRSIVALPATAARGTVSRIVPSLGTGVPATVPRSDIDWVVTEYGAARLRYKNVADRAASLIEIAAPEFRDGLADSWERMHRKVAAT